MGKLADPFAYAAFLKENKHADEAVTRGDLQDDATKDVGHVQAENGTLRLAFTVISSFKLLPKCHFEFFTALGIY